ncbi:MAG: ThiF family adenylyltransferase [Plesiomonas shigelloides]
METIIKHLERCGYQCSIRPEGDWLEVVYTIADRSITLAHKIDEFSYRPVTLPHFVLLEAEPLMPLAHVGLNEERGYGLVCIGDHQSLSINFDRPELVFEESLKRHLTLLNKAIVDPEWNLKELLREFKANWEMLVAPRNQLVLPPNLQRNESLTFKVMAPVPKCLYGINSKHIGVSQDPCTTGRFSAVYDSAKSPKRPEAGDAIVIPLPKLFPAPHKSSEILKWYMATLVSLSAEEQKRLSRWSQIRRKRCWVIFCGETPSGWTWVGLKFERKDGKQKSLPNKVDRLAAWNLAPFRIIPYSRDYIAVRGGALTSLRDKKVLLVGCGSVGGEVARRIASSGVEHIELSDPDVYSEENLYRHCLPERYIGCLKSAGLALELRSQFLWLNAIYHNKTLQALSDQQVLHKFDLVIVAIGSPSDERLFYEQICRLSIAIPIIYTWVEGYGIGGHAILDCPGQPGCFKCAYIDHNSYEHGLASNLNFIEAGQAVTTNHAGCGQNYLPYGANSSLQTAVMASDLAIKYLMGVVTESSKVSWKGNNTDATAMGLHTTYRYQGFTNSLSITALADPLCNCFAG